MPSPHVRWLPYHNRMARPQVADGGDALQVWTVAANILDKRSRTADKGWSSSMGVERGAINSSVLKNKLVAKCHQWLRSWADSLDKRRKRKKTDTRFGVGNVRSLCRAGLLRAVAEEMFKYKLDLVGVQVR
jgi:hypothetical protein